MFRLCICELKSLLNFRRKLKLPNRRGDSLTTANFFVFSLKIAKSDLPFFVSGECLIFTKIGEFYKNLTAILYRK